MRGPRRPACKGTAQSWVSLGEQAALGLSELRSSALLYPLWLRQAGVPPDELADLRAFGSRMGGRSASWDGARRSQPSSSSRGKKIK